MKIAVGSINPSKIKAVENALKRIFPNENLQIEGVQVESKVSDQPMSDDETLLGAKNRAILSQKKINADFGFGLEGGVKMIDGAMYCTSFVVAYSKSGESGIGVGPVFLLPKEIASEINSGKELGDAMDELVGGKDIKKKAGAIGVFTNNLVTRDELFEMTIIFSMVKFISKYFL